MLGAIDLNSNMEDEEILDVIQDMIIRHNSEEYLRMEVRRRLKRELFNSIRRLDVLQELLEDNEITEIMINGANHIFIEKGGHITRWEQQFESVRKLEDVIQQIVSKANRIVNEANPIVDARLMDGSRVNVVLPPISLDGPVITIRKFPDTPITMEQLIEYKAISEEAAIFLRELVIAKYNILVSGGTGSGKTTFLNVLSNFIPEEERIITIEDSAELQLQNIQNLVRLEVRNANVEGKNEITVRDLIKSALRMRPSRIIVGEVRDGAALDLLSAYNTGHDGSMSSGHANNPADMLARLETLVLYAVELPLDAIRKQIASAVDIIVHLGRLRDKSRKVLEIVEVTGYRDGEILLNKLFEFREDYSMEEKTFKKVVDLQTIKEKQELRKANMEGNTDQVSGSLKRTDRKLIHRLKLEWAGIRGSDD